MPLLQTPLARARGKGSAHHGVGHWWAQRATAVALVPLTVWFVISVIGLSGAGYYTVMDWLSAPGNAALLLLVVGFVLYHATLGLQVVLEDYVRCRMLRTVSVLAVKGLALLLAALAAVSILKVAFGG